MQENKKNTLKNTPKEDPPEPCYLCEMDMNEHGHWYIDSEDESVCTPCHDKHFTTCHYCEETYRTNWTIRTEDTQCRYCEHCRETLCIQFDNRSDAWYENGLPNRINSYDYKPETVFHFLNRKNGERLHGYSGRGRLYAGVEIEVENSFGDYNTEDTGREINELVNSELGKDANIYLKEDGSLDNGFEIVSQPRTWASWKRSFKEFEPVFNLNEYGFRSHDTGTCGLHISLSRNAFSESHLLRFQKFVYFNPDFIRVLSRRQLDNLIAWGNPYAIDKTQISEETFKRNMLNELDRDFCENDRYERITDENKNTPFFRHELLRLFVNHNGAPIYTSKALRENRKNKRGTALNLPSGENRVELRFFRGTLKRETFKMNLEFSFCAFDFTKDTNTDSLTVQNLRNFAQKKGYKRVFNYLDALTWGAREKWSQDYIKTIKAETIALSGGNPVERSV